MKNSPRFIIQALAFIFLISACNIGRHHKNKQSLNGQDSLAQAVTYTLDTLRLDEAAFITYKGQGEKSFDLIHTKLAVSFDWKKRRLHGQATLTLTPHFYSQNNLMLDAKGFDIHRIALIQAKDSSTCNFSYDSLRLNIQLPQTFTNKDTIKLYIQYTAKPYERRISGGSAISDDRGLYFINPDGSDPDKPRQIWTQGEPQASSCWFPTIDETNQKCTQQMYITRPAEMISISNGTKCYTIVNKDKSETDVWKMTQPHSPYLFMMAIGDFFQVDDQWRNTPLHYFGDIQYQEYLPEIFGKTPAMLECFSRRLNYDFPWPKYDQVVVHDYVSGAMENTSATVHGEFLQQTSRERLDRNFEDVIAHELFHQWFGDLATADSWTNLTMNESFATYGEYLWNEYAYGTEKAEAGREQDRRTYFSQTANGACYPIVRHYYKQPVELFDAHNYQKGGLVIHALRQQMGDEAFFKTLNLYLTRFAYKNACPTDLQRCAEEVTGKDWGLFFDQWWYAAGHPVLRFTKKYIDSTQSVSILVEQMQEAPALERFEFPLTFEFYTLLGKQTEKVWVNRKFQKFKFQLKAKPLFINTDADHALPLVKKETFTVQELSYKYNHVSTFQDRLEAIKYAADFQGQDLSMSEFYLNGLTDKNDYIREWTNDHLKTRDSLMRTIAINGILDQIKEEQSCLVRSKMIDNLGEMKCFECQDIFVQCCKDSSYEVISSALLALMRVNVLASLREAYPLEKENNKTVAAAVAYLYGQKGTPENYNYFDARLKNPVSKMNDNFIKSFSDYLFRMPENLIEKGLNTLTTIAIQNKDTEVRSAAYFAVARFRKKYDEGKDQDRLLVVKSMLDEIYRSETNARLKERYKQDF